MVACALAESERVSAESGRAGGRRQRECFRVMAVGQSLASLSRRKCSTVAAACACVCACMCVCVSVCATETQLCFGSDCQRRVDGGVAAKVSHSRAQCAANSSFHVRATPSNHCSRQPAISPQLTIRIHKKWRPLSPPNGTTLLADNEK